MRLVKAYAGIGSRETPDPILDYMKNVAVLLANNGYLLRSGGAKGADSAFEEGCDRVKGKKEIFYPERATDAAIKLASDLHPAWHRCSSYARKLHGRNVQIIKGRYYPRKIHSVKFVVCWQDPNKKFGGTRMGMSVAERFGIDVWNLAIVELREAFEHHIINKLGKV